MLKKISLIFYFGIVQGYYDKITPLVPMRDYGKNFRTLACYECFLAEGKMCRSKDGSSLVHATGSSNKGHIPCCKPNYFGKYCYNDDKIICSQPATGSQSKYEEILTDGKNY